MKRKQLTIAVLSGVMALSMAACSGSGSSTASTSAETTKAEETTAAAETQAETEAPETEAAKAEENKELAAPSDFTVDIAAGTYSFTANDANVGYYFIRLFTLDENGQEGDLYIASSNRIAGGKTGQISGTCDFGQVAVGTYDAKLIAYAPAGTDYESPDPVILKIQTGVGAILEQPEMLVMTDGNEMECVIDYYTLSDWYAYQYLPEVKFTVYSDEACTEEVFSDTVDTSVLADTMSETWGGGGYCWGTAQDAAHKITITVQDMWSGQESSQEVGFANDIYTYTLSDMGLDAGTYYVTCTALASDEYSNDSAASEAVAVTLTEDEPSGTAEVLKTAGWADPSFQQSLYGTPGAYTDRGDFAADQQTETLILG